MTSVWTCGSPVNADIFATEKLAKKAAIERVSRWKHKVDGQLNKDILDKLLETENYELAVDFYNEHAEKEFAWEVQKHEVRTEVTEDEE